MGNTNIANIIVLHETEKRLIDINGKREQLPERIASINEQMDLLSKKKEESKKKEMESTIKEIANVKEDLKTEDAIADLKAQGYEVQQTSEME